MLHHRAEGTALRGFGESKYRSGIHRRQKSFPHSHKKPAGGKKQNDGQHHGHKTVTQAALQCLVVNMSHPILHALEGVIHSPVLLFLRRTQKSAAQHGRQSQRNKSGNKNRGNNRHGKFMQQSSEYAAQKQNGDKNGGQRKSHRKNRESDFLRAIHGRFHHAFAFFHVADNVFQHDDGVVHDEAHRKRQRHQRQVIQRIIQQVHHGERA